MLHHVSESLALFVAIPTIQTTTIFGIGSRNEGHQDVVLTKQTPREIAISFFLEERLNER
jgi:hypothetical protein